MTDGIYSVRFKSPRDSGTGTAIFMGHKVYGGDTAYLYKGEMKMDGDMLSGKIQVTRHSPGESIFGPMNNFDLELTGSRAGDDFHLQGNVSGQPHLKITIDGKKVSDL